MKNQVLHPMSFGQFFRAKRMEQNLTLRGFCEHYGYDAGNISRLERNILSPSVDEKKLRAYAQALKIEPESTDWVTFFDLAHVAKGTIPTDIRKNIEFAKMLPAFYRSVRGEKLTKKKIEKLIELINQANSTEDASE